MNGRAGSQFAWQRIPLDACSQHIYDGFECSSILKAWAPSLCMRRCWWDKRLGMLPEFISYFPRSCSCFAIGSFCRFSFILPPGRWFSDKFLGTVLSQANEEVKAGQIWQEAERICYLIVNRWQRVECLSMLGVFLAQVGKYEHARKIWQEAEQECSLISKHEQHMGALVALGRVLIKAEELQLPGSEKSGSCNSPFALAC